MLRDYQLKLKNDIYSQFRNGKKYVLAQLATGGGKTYVFCSISKQMADAGKRVLILVHRTELSQQTVKTLSSLGVDAKEFNAKTKQLGEVTVAMVETIKRNSNSDKLANHTFDLIIIDETHLGNFFAVFEMFKESRIIGFSATPISAQKKKPLNKFYDVMVQGISINELIESGKLCKCKTIAPKLIDRNNLSEDNLSGDFSDESQMMEFGDSRVYGGILEAYQLHNDRQKAVIFCVNTIHSKEMAEYFVSKGYNARHLDGKATQSEREDTLKWLKFTPDAILCNCAILTTGFDEPSLQVIITARATQSTSLWFQMCGRGGRISDGKDTFTVIDAGQNYKAHGTWDSWYDWQVQFNPEESVTRQRQDPQGEVCSEKRVCKGCNAVIDDRIIICPYCGLAKEQKKDTEDVVDYEEVTVSDVMKINPATMTVDQLFERAKIGNGTIPYKPSWIVYKIMERTDRYEVKVMLLEYASKMGYKKGFAFHKLKEWDEMQKEKELLDIA